MGKKLLALALGWAALLSAAPATPKLVLFVVVDQCRYDYLTRFRREFTGGFDLLLKRGASFTNANDDFFPTLTASSHATLLTGAMPSATGIAGNEWYDRKLKQHIMSVSDDSVHPVGTDQGVGSSPHLLLVPTVGDDLKKAHTASRVFGVSIKDRSAILLAGLHPDGAFWFDDLTGRFVTSSYYRSELPAWAEAFNRERQVDRFVGATWLTHTIATEIPTAFAAIHRSPFGDQLSEAFAERTISAEHLGSGPDTDLLAVSLSSLDYAGHDYGHDTPEMHESILRMDRLVGKLLQFVDANVGLASTLVVLTSDHGIPPASRGGRVPLQGVTDAIQAALTRKHGPGNWVAGCWDVLVYLNRDLIAEKKLNIAEVNREAAAALRTVPHIARAYTREQLMNGRSGDQMWRRMKDGFNTERGADIEFMPEEYWVFTGLKTTHGSTYSYDTHVPLIFMGQGIRAGSRISPVRTNDVAPTIAAMIGVPAPRASVGRTIPGLIAK